MSYEVNCLHCSTPLFGYQRKYCDGVCQRANRNEKNGDKELKKMKVEAMLNRVKDNSSSEAYNIVKWDIITQIHAKDFSDDPCQRVVDEWLSSIHYLLDESDDHEMIRKSASVDQMNAASLKLMADIAA